jgi:hypothetical protein
MDVIFFLCVSFGSSTVQLHDSLDSRRACACSEAGFSNQNGDRAWGVYYRRAAFCYAFLLAKGLNAKDIHKEMSVLFKVGSVCRVKRFTSVWPTFRWWRRGWNEGAEVAEKTLKRLLCCGLLRTDKAMGQVYQCWRRMCWEINVFFIPQVRISHVLRFISICDLFTDSQSEIFVNIINRKFPAKSVFYADLYLYMYRR